MKSLKTIFGISLLLLPFQILSQSTNDVEMADPLRSNGKIYVVVIGLVVILTGLIALLLRIEKKLRHLENNGNSALK